MKRKILCIEIISSILTLFVLFIVSCIYVNNQNYDTAKNELYSYSNIACEVFDGTNFDELKDVMSKTNEDIRISVIDLSGNVIVDSSLNDAENHLNREELQKIGECVTRYSDSLKLNMMYLAKVDDGYYIRLSLPIQSLTKFINNYIGFGLISLIIILSISITVTSLLYNKTLKPIKNEINKLETILDNKLTNDTDFELLSSKINELTVLLNEKVTSLSNEKEKSKYILDNMNQGLVLLNNEGKIELINKYLLSLFGFEQDYILNKNYMYLFRDIFVQEKIENCIKNNQEEQLIYDLEGRKFLLYINILETSWSNASNFHVALLMVDITLQENMNSLKREFFANASHELKSPLTSIIGYQQLIQQGILTTKEEIQDATLRTIKEAQRMNKLIIEMLDLSRLENNVLTTIEDVNVSKIINDCLLEFKIAMDNKNIQVEKNLEDVILSASQSDLYKLIKNILDNSIAYNNDFGKIIITLNKDKLIISDTGIGISKKDLEHIFERFYRVDKARSKQNSGTGLGLSIVKHVCLSYGYKINVESVLGKGTTITILFS
ncbi:MAG: ATP-binding protein [Anaeroplasma sp.]|uniref:sensor histidine kinase n=1 Tax=Anaeroplasma sp. TaxID=1872523 RepID=UPI002A91A542|nr:ATP-binding protein [Anaeroplasma sp.]MDY5983402.1 ATP-binding protein [Anaeroplasma sp.]